MIPNIDMHEQFAREHRQTLLREAELERRLSEARPALAHHWGHRLAARLGGYLVTVGTRLQRALAVE